MPNDIVIEACKDEDSRKYGQLGYPKEKMDDTIKKEIYYNQESLSFEKFKNNAYEEYYGRNVNLDDEILGYVYYDYGGRKYLNVHRNSDMGNLDNVRIYRKKTFAESAFNNILKNLGVNGDMLKHYKLYPIKIVDDALYIRITDKKRVAM